jgi:hypothetical protein
MNFTELYEKIEQIVYDELNKDHPATVSEDGMFEIPWNTFVVSLTDLGYPSDWCDTDGHKKLLKTYAEILEDSYGGISVYYELPVQMQPKNKSIFEALRKREGKESHFIIVVKLH